MLLTNNKCKVLNQISRYVIVRVLYRYDCVACDAGQLFKCHNTDRCIRADDYFCNGYDDCEDGSDEPVNCSE